MLWPLSSSSLLWYLMLMLVLGDKRMLTSLQTCVLVDQSVETQQQLQ